jgi:UDP-N-acetylmuramate--alanine ligase
VQAAERAGREPLLYAEALGRLSAEAETLAIAGTHGKTSTTALAAAALRGGGVDASHIVGGDVEELGGSGYAGASPWLVVEACEFDRSFHRLRPRASVVLNTEHDHFDCYPTAACLVDAFAVFAAQTRPGGLVVVPADAPAELTARIEPDRVIRRFGTDRGADVHARNVSQQLGCYAFTPHIAGEELPRVALAVPGRFQMQNALCALTLALWAGADPAGACRALSCFHGVRRRFEVRIGAGGGAVVNDYAHHPTELAALIAAAKQRFPGRRLIAAFQPHQHQRTAALLGQFAEVLARVDHTLIADIYGARESAEVRALVSAEQLVSAVRARGGHCEAAGGLVDVPGRVMGQYRRGDVILMIGAGDIDQVVKDVVAAV